MTSYANPGSLIDTARLADHLTDPDIAIVEVDEDTTAYDKGHIPGSVALDWEHELRAMPRRDFVSADQLAALLGSRGITADQTIVLYGGNNNWFAAYAYWLFRMRGVEKIQLLDGGRKKWELESRTLDTERPARPSRTFRMGHVPPGHPDFPGRGRGTGDQRCDDGRRPLAG